MGSSGQCSTSDSPAWASSSSGSRRVRLGRTASPRGSSARSDASCRSRHRRWRAASALARPGIVHRRDPSHADDPRRRGAAPAGLAHRSKRHRSAQSSEGLSGSPRYFSTPFEGRYEPVFVSMGKEENGESSTGKAEVLREMRAALRREWGVLGFSWDPPERRTKSPLMSFPPSSERSRNAKSSKPSPHPPALAPPAPAPDPPEPQKRTKYDELVDVLADGLLALLVDNKDAP